ncbi:MAG: hypothetical protein D3917_16935 [Candidatus Electrothrix sp. AX5]|nr:hypothetical protein [Candidatus Electrothrix sp. AX5]
MVSGMAFAPSYFYIVTMLAWSYLVVKLQDEACCLQQAEASRSFKRYLAESPLLQPMEQNLLYPLAYHHSKPLYYPPKQRNTVDPNFAFAQ